MFDDCVTKWGDLCQSAEGTEWGKLVVLGLVALGVVWLYRRG